MTVMRYTLLLLGAIAVLPATAQSPSAKSQAVFTASQLPERCTPLFARYERLKEKDRLMEPDNRGTLAWVGITKDLRREVSQAITGYEAALKAGWKAADPDLKKARGIIEDLLGRMEKLGVWTSFRWDDPPLPGGARDRLDAIRSKAWEAALLAGMGQPDAASRAFQFARKLLKEIDDEIEAALDQGQQVEDYRKHPAYARTVAEVDRLEASAKGALDSVQARREQFAKDVEALAGVVQNVDPFLREVDTVTRLSGTEENIVAGIERFLPQLEAFERGAGAKAREMLESFGSRYGTDRDAIQKSANEILGNKPLQVPQSPQSLFERLEGARKQVAEVKPELSRELVGIAKRNAETTAVDPARREQSFAMAKRCLALALQLDPANREASTLQGSLGAAAAGAAETADALLDSGTWEPHSSAFQGPGDAGDLARSAQKWLAGDKGWTKDKEILAVRVNGDWVVAARDRLGKPASWGLPVEAAFVRNADRDAGRDVAWVYRLTMVTRDVEKSPPWKDARVGSNRKMRATKIRAADSDSDSDAGGAAPNLLFRLLLVAALLGSGLLLAGPFLITKVPALATPYGWLKPIRPLVGVATLVIGVVLLVANLLSPFSNLLPQAAAIIAGLFLGLELLLRKPGKLAAAEGDDALHKAGQGVDTAVQKAQDFLASHEQSVRRIEKYQIPLGIACLVLALLHLVAAGATFL